MNRQKDKIKNARTSPHKLVLTAIMTAVAVVSRAAFYFVPQFKPIIAVVIIAGVALGCKSGFVCGALSMLCSNFLFGQGIWTIWQMGALGLIGFLSGFLGKTKITKSLPFLIFFGLVSGFLYSVIVDLWMIFSLGDALNLYAALSVLALSLPFSLTLSLATAIFILLLAKPLIQKIERIKIKYGLFSVASDNKITISQIPPKAID